MLPDLRTAQAVALPVTEEAGGDLRLFTIGPRLTPHVRHREKYVDVPVSEARGFVFGVLGQPGGARVRTLREFVAVLDRRTGLDGYLKRNDFSRWIRDVFGDHALAADVHALETRHRDHPSDQTVAAVAAAVRARYDLSGSDRRERGRASEPALAGQR
jgi:hypothetical protein